MQFRGIPAWFDEEQEIILANRIRSGDREAFEQFAASFAPRLMNYSLFVCRQREDAEEVVQDTLLALLDRIGELRESRKLRPWAFRIAKNVCLMKRRKSVFAPSEECNFSELAPEQREIADWSATPNLLSEYGELTSELHRAVQALPEDYRTVFLLRQSEGLSTEETAQALGVSIDTVKTRLKRARAAIRRSIDHRG